jgi:fructose-bisphosphate aldolase class II
VTLAPTADLVADAVGRGRAVPAVNVVTLEYAEAIVDGAERAEAGIILQLSQNAIRFHGSFRPILAACRELAGAAAVPVALHLDHIDDGALVDAALQDAAELGLGSIMVDFATRDYADNVAATADAAARGRVHGLLIEAELGAIGGKDGAHAPGVRTDPVEAAAFVAATGVDALAVAVGSSHAMRDRSAMIDHDLVSRLAAAVPVPLVLHGSSGVSDRGLTRAVAAGIRKVNVGTALTIAYDAAVRGELAAHPDRIDPRPPLRTARAAMADVAEHVCRLLTA